jgi:Polyketide cyclase / dehydrase and lipid transport
MATESQHVSSEHVSVTIDRPVAAVYDFASVPENLPQWAPGLGCSVELVDGKWTADSPMGRVSFVFVPRNEYGVLDHDVTLPSGETVYNPMRVIATDAGCEVVFTVRRRPGMSDDDFAGDVAAVAADLALLKQLLEAGEEGTDR